MKENSLETIKRAINGHIWALHCNKFGSCKELLDGNTFFPLLMDGAEDHSTVIFSNSGLVDLPN